MLAVLYKLAMALTTDTFFERIGSFGRFQIALNLFFNLCSLFWWAVPVTIMVFIASEPNWKCVNNSTCPFTDSISIRDERYNHRCNISRRDWRFEDDFTSVVTEVCAKPDQYPFVNYTFELQMGLYMEITWRLWNDIIAAKQRLTYSGIRKLLFLLWLNSGTKLRNCRLRHESEFRILGISAYISNHTRERVGELYLFPISCYPCPGRVGQDTDSRQSENGKER